jgi:hypothetical protein
MFPIGSLSGRYLCTSYGIIDKASDDHSNNCADCVDNEIAHARVATWNPVLRDLKCSGKNGHSDYLIKWGGAICQTQRESSNSENQEMFQLTWNGRRGSKAWWDDG